MNKTIYFFTLIFFTLISCGVRKSLENRPDLSTFQSKQYSRNEINDSLFYIENNFLKKNKAQN